MKKLLSIQKIMFVVYIISMILILIYSLGFMTSYSDFQYLAYRENKVLYDFHHNTLIPYNNVVFNLAIVSIITIICLFICKINKQIPKIWQASLGTVITIPTIISCIYSIIKLPGIKKQYNSFDFSNVEAETYNVYNPSTFAFDFGMVLSIIVLVMMIIYIAVIITNCVLSIKSQIEVHNELVDEE